MSNYTLSATFGIKDQFTSKIKKIKAETKKTNEAFKRLDNSKFGKLESSFSKLTSKISSQSKKMSNNLKDVDSSLLSAFSEKETKFKGFETMRNSFGTAVKDMVKTATLLGAGVSAGVAVAFGAFQKHAELQQVLIKNKVLLNANAEESKKLEEQVTNLGKTTAFTAKEVAMAQKYQIMAGYDLNKVLETTPKLLKLSIVAEEDLARTSDLVTDTMDALGLMEAFLGGASTGVAMGDSLEDVSKLLGVLANNGKKASEAGTFLNAIYSNFTSASQTNSMMIKEQIKHNIKFYKKNKDGAVVFKGMSAILKELKPKLDKMTEAQRNQFLSIMVGKEHLSDFIKLLNASPESYKNMDKAIEESSGSLDDLSKKLENTDLQQIENMKSSFEGLQIAIGKAIAPIMLEGIGKITAFFNQLSDNGNLNPENVKAYFETMKSSMKSALAIASALWFTTTSIRALMGDPTAIANLALGAGAFGAYLGLNGAEKIEKLSDPKPVLDEKGEEINNPFRQKAKKPRGFNTGYGVKNPYISDEEQETIDESAEMKLNRLVHEVGKNNLNFQPRNTTQQIQNIQQEQEKTKKIEIKIDMSNMKIDGGVTETDVKSIINTAIGGWELKLSDNLNLGGAF